jgi:hypothetical protein
MRKTLELFSVAALLVGTIAFLSTPAAVRASGGGGGGGSNVDTIKVSKCYYDAPTGEMLIKASSSDPTATLHAYFLSGASLGWVQNGGGSRYGGTVMGYVGADPVYIVILSSSGGSITVPTTPFQI